METCSSPDSASADQEAAALTGQRRYMEAVCRALASRLERRKHLLLTAARFYRLMEQVRTAGNGGGGGIFTSYRYLVFFAYLLVSS